jgi:hypothetical protein
VAEDLFVKRARLQLFGHKHRQRLTRIEDGVRVSAGAMQPDVREPHWQPRYNFIQISIVKNGEERSMLVRIHPRVFREDAGGRFMAETQENGDEFREFILPLPEWRSPKAVEKRPAVSVGAPAAVSVEAQRGPNMMSARKLTYKFLSLPHHRQLAIAQQLGLVRDEDEGARDNELYRRYFNRDQQENKLEELWKAVEKLSAELETHRDSTGAA